MRNRILLASVFVWALVFAPGAVLGQDAMKASAKPGSAQNKAAEEEVVRLMQEWAAASRNSDAATLDRLFRDDLEYIHTTSKVSYKKDFLDEIKAGDRRWEHYDLSNVKARVFGNAAIATTNIHIKVILQNSRSNELRAIVSVFWVKEPQWRIAELHFTRLPDKP